MKKNIIGFLTAVLLLIGLVLPAQAASPRLVDEAGLLTEKESSKLLEKLDKISTEQQLDVVIVTVDSLGQKTSQAYADDYFDYEGYGQGESLDGILLLVSMEDRDWAISTHGYGITAFTDAGLSYMQEKFRPYLSEGEYAKAFEKFADLCEKFIKQAKKGKPYDNGNMPKEPLSWVWIPGDLLIGCGIAVVVALTKKGQLKSVRKKVLAQAYVVPGSQNVTDCRDFLVNRFTTTRIIEHHDDHPGGSSTHQSSSGSTHGGASGKF